MERVSEQQREKSKDRQKNWKYYHKSDGKTVSVEREIQDWIASKKREINNERIKKYKNRGQIKEEERLMMERHSQNTHTI